MNAVVVIGGVDSSGGAGVTRDAATLGELGCTARPVVTAVTAQTDDSVRSVWPVPATVVAAQLDAALAGDVGAVKTGMLVDAGRVLAIARVLRDHAGIPVVVDPVLASSSGTDLLDAAGRQAVLEHLLPLATLVTPNLAEARALTGEGLVHRQAGALMACGAGAVLVKGGHGASADSVDVLCRAGEARQKLTRARIDVKMRGTGCMLASAIAAGLAGGADMHSACVAAKSFVWQKLVTAAAA